MLLEDIKKLISNTPRKERATRQAFEQAVTDPVRWEFTTTRPGPDSRLTEYQWITPPAPQSFWMQESKRIDEILAYTHGLGLAQQYHDKDIKLLLEAVGKHYLWKETNYTFVETELDLKVVFQKELKKPVVPLGKEPHWVIKEWDEIMTFALCGRHLQLGRHTVEDWDKPVDTMPGSFQQTPNPKSKGKGTIPTTPDIEPSSSQNTSSQQQRIQPPADDVTHTSNDEDDNNEDEGSDDHNSLPELPPDRTTAGRDDDPNDSSDSSSSDSQSSASSNKPSNRRRGIIKLTRRGKTLEQIEWQAISGSVAPDPRLSKKLKNIQIDAPENLNG